MLVIKFVQFLQQFILFGHFPYVSYILSLGYLYEKVKLSYVQIFLFLSKQEQL